MIAVELSVGAVFALGAVAGVVAFGLIIIIAAVVLSKKSK